MSWEKHASDGSPIVGTVGVMESIAFSASDALYTSGTVILSGGANVTVGTNAGQTVTISAAAQTVQTQNRFNLTMSGNTSGALAAVSSGTLTLAGGNNITLSQAGNAVTISAAAAVAQSAQSLGVYGSSQTTGGASSTTVDARSITLVGQGAVSVGASNGSVQISAPNTVAQSAQSVGIYASSQTTGASSSSTGDARSLTIVGRGAVSAGWSNGSFQISAPNTIAQSEQTQNLVDVTLDGNTAGALALVSSGTVTLAGGNNVTLSQAGNAVTISGPNTVAQSNQSLGIYAVGNTTGESSSSTRDARSLSIEGAGIVSVGMSGGTVRISAPAGGAQSNQTEGWYALGQTTGESSSTTRDARSISVEGAGIVSVGFSGGSLRISATEVAQTAQSIGIYGSSQTVGGASSGTVDARSLTVVGRGAVSVGMTNGSFEVSAPDTIAQTNQSVGLYGSSQTTGAASSTTVDARSITLVGRGAVSVGASNGSWQISAPDTIAQTVQSIGIYGSSQTTGAASSTTVDARSLTLVGRGAVSVGASNGSWQISAPDTISQSAESQSIGASNLGNTLGTSGVASGAQVRMVVAGTNWLSISQSVNGASGTMTLDPGGYMSRWGHNTAAMLSSSTSNMVNTSVSIIRMEVPHYVTFSRVDMMFQISLATQSSTNTAGNRQTWRWALYTRNASTLTPIVGGESSKTQTWASSTGNYNSLTGPRVLSFAVATALTPGEYYFGVMASSSTYSDTNAANTTALSMSLSPVYGTTYTAAPFADINSGVVNTVNPFTPLQGVGSVSLSATNQTYQVSDISHSGVLGVRANNIIILRNI